MTNSAEKRQEVIYALTEVVVKSQAIDRVTLHFGTDMLLHPSEIHMIVAIAKSPEPHVIGLAKELKITKGAVSQIVKKLEEKGMIKKNGDPGNRSKYLLELTPKGVCAYDHHSEFHGAVDAVLMRILDKLPDEDVGLLLKTFKEIDEGIRKLL